MKYSLVSRELIADSTEAMAIAHAFDALVMVPNCDKNVPGLLMAAARLNIPTILVSGGAMSAGIIGKKKLSLVSAFEGVGAYKAGKIDAKKLTEIEQKCCPSCGSCSGMFTANSMNCLTEVLGMGLPGNGTIPAVQSARIRLAKQAGMKVMELLEKNIRPRDIMTYDAFLNAMTVDMALGCSTNSMLHLPAIAHECGYKLDMHLANEISEKTPNLCHLSPAGPHFIEELNEAGGIPAVMKELDKKGLLKTDLMTVTGKTVAENIADAENKDEEIIRPIDPNRLKAAIESYNKVARHEVETDQFGFKANHTDDRPMTEGPWYVARKVPTIHHTMGGIHIDTGAHAVNANGQRIPGLYAAGEVTGGIHGANRLGGNAVADLMVFGRIAGKNAAEAK